MCIAGDAYGHWTPLCAVLWVGKMRLRRRYLRLVTMQEIGIFLQSIAFSQALYARGPRMDPLLRLSLEPKLLCLCGLTLLTNCKHKNRVKGQRGTHLRCTLTIYGLSMARGVQLLFLANPSRNFQSKSAKSGLQVYSYHLQVERPSYCWQKTSLQLLVPLPFRVSKFL